MRKSRRSDQPTFLKYLPSEEERRTWDALQRARDLAGKFWRTTLDPESLTEIRRKVDQQEIYAELTGQDVTAWNRPEGGEGYTPEKIEQARRVGWSPLGLHDLATQIGHERAVALFERSHTFINSVLGYRRDKMLALFLEALRADVGATTRTLKRIKYPELSEAEAREAVYQEHYRLKIPPEERDALPLDHLPDDVHLEAMIARAKAQDPPDSAVYYRDLVHILRAAGLGRRRAADWAYDHVIVNIGLNLVPGWDTTWEQIRSEEVLRTMREQDDLTEP